MTESFEQLLNTLKSERESQQLDIKQVSNETRINPDFIEAIENHNIDVLPEGYEKIFVKSYLKYLKLNTEENIQCVDDYFNQSKNFPDSSGQVKKDSVSIDLTQFKTLIVWAPIILVIFALIYIVYTNFEQREVQTVQELTVEEGLATVDTLTYEAPDSLKLTISSLDDVFIYIVIDSVQSFRRTMSKGQRWNLIAKQEFNIYANLGDRISITLNDNVIGQVAQPGQRLNFLILDHNGIKNRGVSTIRVASGDSL